MIPIEGESGERMEHMVVNLPLYWRNERTGILAAAITAYLSVAIGERTPDTVTDEQIELIRSYFQHWINFDGWDTAGPEFRDELTDLRRLIRDTHSVSALKRWTRKALDLGIDPL